MNVRIPILAHESHEDKVVAFYTKEKYFIFTLEEWETFREPEAIIVTKPKNSIEDIVIRLSKKLAPEKEIIPLEEMKEDTSIQDLNLSLRENILSSVVRINDEAGPDGSELTSRQIAGICKIVMNEDADNRIRRAALDRIIGLPLAKLQKHRDSIPKELRIKIAMERVKNLPQGNHGEGSSFIPMDWSSFIEAEEDRDKEVLDVMSKAGPIRDHQAPKDENIEIITSGLDKITKETTIEDIKTRLSNALKNIEKGE